MLNPGVGRQPRTSGRAPINTSGGRRPTDDEFRQAIQLIGRSGVLEALQARLDSRAGRPRALSLQGFLVAAQLNAFARHHAAHLTQIARTLNALSDDQRKALGIGRWNPEQAYDRVEYLFLKLSKALERGWESCVDGRTERIDSQWFGNRISRAAFGDDAPRSRSLAVDGTDVETWGALRGDASAVEPDGDSPEVSGRAEHPSGGRQRGGGRGRRGAPGQRARILGIGPDGRKIYTPDPDARAGHRSATNSRSAGTYVGYELHLAVQTRDVKWSNGIDRTTLGPEVPNVVTNLSLVPAGSHRARAIVPELLSAKERGQELDDVAWDPGYSLSHSETAYYPLQSAEVHTTFQPATHQRGRRPSGSDALLIDGHLFSPLLPSELMDLPMPPRGASLHEKLEYERAFNQRARFRYIRHAGPEADGTTRWRCPFCSGLLRSRAFPRTMRRSRQVPLVPVPEGTTECCSGIFSATAAQLPLWQRLPFGTTAWRVSMGRRQAAESANAALKGGFVDIGRKFFRVFGLAKLTILLSFTIASFNLDRVRSFLAKHGDRGPAAGLARTRRKRRMGIWTELLPAQPAEGGPAPPD
jgi:hypothetical protein